MQLRNPHTPRKGAVAVLVALLLAALLGVLAIALDGGLLMDSRRQVQSAADAAALAGASELYLHYLSLSTTNYDPGKNADTRARAVATANGFPNDGTTASVSVNIPPTSGLFVGKTGYVEVIITYYQPRFFSTIWGSGSLPVQARSVAYGGWDSIGDGVIVLDPTAKNSLNGSGGSSLVVTGGANVIVDSNDPAAAADVTGGGAMTASAFKIVGGYSGTFNGTVSTGVLPIPDPLAYLPQPSVPQDGIMTTSSLGNGNHQFLLTPGRYSNLPTFNSGDVVILQQANDAAGNNIRGASGLYYLDGGGFKSTGANITMDPTTSGGVMIFNAPTSTANAQQIQITGNSAGTVGLSPLTSGPYSGILFWQDRSATQPVSISGNGTFSLQGTLYGANALMTVSGNGNVIVGSQYISRKFNTTGSGTVNIDYSDNKTARKRVLRLVE